MTDESRNTSRFAYIEVSGGRFDGDTIRVECDADGRPPATWHGSELTPNTSPELPPHLSHLPGVNESLYTLARVPDPDDGGTKWVYRCDVTMFDDLGVAGMWNPSPDDPFGIGRQAA